MNKAQTLRELFVAMIDQDAQTLRHGEWRSDLPTFGGQAPDDISEVWSWDETSLIVGTCPPDLEIMTREEWAEGGAMLPSIAEDK